MLTFSAFLFFFPFTKRSYFLLFFHFFFIFFSKNTRLLSCLSKKKAGQKTPTQKSNDHIKVDVTLIKRGRVGKTEVRRKRRLCVSSERVPHPHRVPLPPAARRGGGEGGVEGRRRPLWLVPKRFFVWVRETPKEIRALLSSFFFASLLLLLLAR